MNPSIQGTLISNSFFFIFTILILKVWLIAMSHEETAQAVMKFTQGLVTWPQALYWQVFLFLPQVWTLLSVLWCAWEYTWGPKCTLYMRSVPASHLCFLWLRNSDRPLAHSPDAHSAHRSLLLLPVLTERQRCWGKWDKTAQKSCWYRLPGLDCWVNDPECVNCVRQCQRTVWEMEGRPLWAFQL